MQQLILDKTVEFVKETLRNAEGGHDWWHVYRVWKLAKQIALKEQVNLLVVELGALLHDIADSKFYDGDETIGPKKARIFLTSIGVEPSVIKHIEKIITNISFRGEFNQLQFKSSELNVIQDADRLDAMGAIGIARAFNYGGFKNRAIYHPDIQPNLNLTKEAYKNSSAPTINHFYEKLLLLKDRMNTSTGKAMAKHRHQFLKNFLAEFYAEWEGEV